MRFIFYKILFLSFLLVVICDSEGNDGQRAYKMGLKYLREGKNEEAAEKFWISILHSDNLEHPYTLMTAFENFMASYKNRNILDQGILRVAKQYIAQNVYSDAKVYLLQALAVNPKLVEAHLLLAKSPLEDSNSKLKHLIEALSLDPNGYNTNFEAANELWNMRVWDR